MRKGCFMTNRLAEETSPYLLQHAENPVDWFPWGDVALARAREDNKPIFLSIGYSACHWCHVMEHESFEHPEIAQELNEHFVCIKVDREERPDLDQIYMNAVQMMTGRGGWPMSVFLTPDLEPFFGGTYWPPENRGGMPGFRQVIAAIHDAWQNRETEARNQARRLAEHMRQVPPILQEQSDLSLELLHGAVAALERQFDFQHGGFGGAPKFPHSMDLQVLLREYQRSQREDVLRMVTITLDKMAAGGIHDHLGGGFHRYSVDERWLVPHFEKMLYDNALLAKCYLEGFQVTGKSSYAEVARGILDYVLRDMTDPGGGFYSAEDADSEGEEGKFFVWTPDEVHEVLGDDLAEVFCYCYDISSEGNFEGRNIPNLPKTLEQCAAVLDHDAEELKSSLAEARAKLFARRESRVRPGLDDKILVSWNGLMIEAFAYGGRVLEEPRYTAAALKAASFLFEQLEIDGRLRHAWCQGQAKFNAYLDDYAALASACIALYEATFKEEWLVRAVRLLETIHTHFADESGGALFFTSDDHEQLIVRQKELQDSSVPSGNALAATALLRAAALCGRQDFRDAAAGILQATTGLMRHAPAAAGQMLIALDLHLGPLHELAIVGQEGQEDTEAVVAEARRRLFPRAVLAGRLNGPVSKSPVEALFAGREPREPLPNLHVCQEFTCQAPALGKEAALGALNELRAT